MSTTFKIGDRVVLVKDRGFARKGMKGTVVTNIICGDYGAKFDEKFDEGHSLGGSCDMGYGYWIAPDEMELIPQFEVGQIYRVGKLYFQHHWEDSIIKLSGLRPSGFTVKAIRGVAPKDFGNDSEYANALTLLTGAEIGEAIRKWNEDHAPKPEYREVKRHAKVGEHIKIVRCNSNMEGYRDGDILKVIANSLGSQGVFVQTKEHHPEYRGADRKIEPPYSYAREIEYVVLEGYNLDSKHSYTAEQIEKAKQIVLDTIHEFYSESKGSVVLSTGVSEPKTIHAYVFEKGNSSITSGAGGTVPFMADKVAHGSAKCSDNDEPNEWIGKCVALCKALHNQIPTFITED